MRPAWACAASGPWRSRSASTGTPAAHASPRPARASTSAAIAAPATPARTAPAAAAAAAAQAAPERSVGGPRQRRPRRRRRRRPRQQRRRPVASTRAPRVVTAVRLRAMTHLRRPQLLSAVTAAHIFRGSRRLASTGRPPLTRPAQSWRTAQVRRHLQTPTTLFACVRAMRMCSDSRPATAPHHGQPRRHQPRWCLSRVCSSGRRWRVAIARWARTPRAGSPPRRCSATASAPPGRTLHPAALPRHSRASTSHRRAPRSSRRCSTWSPSSALVAGMHVRCRRPRQTTPTCPHRAAAQQQQQQRQCSRRPRQPSRASSFRAASGRSS